LSNLLPFKENIVFITVFKVEIRAINLKNIRFLSKIHRSREKISISKRISMLYTSVLNLF